MKVTITVDRDALIELIANSLRFHALEKGGVEDWWGFWDCMSNGLGEYFYAEDGDYFTPYNDIAEVIVEEMERCQ